MKASELRALTGKKVTWLHHGYRVRVAKVLEVRGRNIRVDDHGSEDWLWIPDMREIREVLGPAPKQEGASE